MQIGYAFYSTEGPVRPQNEDSVAFWQPVDPMDWRTRGALVVLADGIGGQERGEVASQLVCETAINAFTEAEEGVAPNQLIFRVFTAANLAVYDRNLTDRHAGGRMATTMTACLFRHNEVTIGHVGDCRVYILQAGKIRRLTNDHSYAGVQLKLGLVNVQEAASSEFRSVLTRSVGQEPTIRVDIHVAQVRPGDVVVQCCDGVWSKITEGEILSVASKMPPAEASRELVRLAERRSADDNLTVQIVRVEGIERLSYYRGLPTYQKETPAIMGQELEVGQVLDGRYRVTDLVARSGMAAIFKGVDTTNEQVVALKVPFMQFESDPGFYSRFQREQEIGRALQHPYILHLLDSPDQKKSRPYLVMEFLEGQTLAHLMQRVHPIPEHDAIKLVSRICEALHYMHEHDVVHRDLKPDNVMICNDGSIRIMDFGIAKFEGSRRLTFGGFTPAMGTPDYMAPEQVRGKRGDRRTDIYSLGAILYEMVSGQTPFQGENPFIIMNSRLSGDPIAPREVSETVSLQVEEIILHAMSRLPQDRYPDALSMKAELDSPEKVQLTGRATRLVRPNPLYGRWRKIRFFAIFAGIPILLFVGFWLHKHVQFK
jgi:serine/threonine protein phosphatase PrpC